MTIPKGPSVKKARQMIAADPQKGWTEMFQQYGKNFIFQGSLVTSDAVVARTMLMEREHTLQRSGVYKFMSWLIPGAPGVLFMEGEKWQQHVQAIMPVFTKSMIDTYAKTIHDIVLKNTRSWKDGMQFEDLYLTVTQIGLQVVLNVGYGLNPDHPTAAAYGKELMEYKLMTMTSESRIDELGFSADQLLLIPSLIKNIRHLQHKMKVQQKLLKQILAERKEHNEYGTDWISLFVKAGFSIDEMTNELNHVYGAFNAIDYTITCALYQLSRNKELLDTIRKELKEVIGLDRSPNREDIESLSQTMNFMKEVYRYYPVAIAVMRKTGKPLALDGSVYPKGKEVVIALQAMHHHPDYWDEPENFNPNRWQSPLKEPRAYIPFLQGPRQCIGKHLAEFHFLITLNAIIQYWDIQIDTAPQIGKYIIPRFDKPLPAIIHQHITI